MRTCRSLGIITHARCSFCRRVAAKNRIDDNLVSRHLKRRTVLRYFIVIADSQSNENKSAKSRRIIPCLRARVYDFCSKIIRRAFFFLREIRLEEANATCWFTSLSFGHEFITMHFLSVYFLREMEFSLYKNSSCCRFLIGYQFRELQSYDVSLAK